jgi:hypothetical protein
MNPGLEDTVCQHPPLIHVAVANPKLHACRFDLGAFYREARRILRPHGALAAWSYTCFDFPGCPAAGEVSSHALLAFRTKGCLVRLYLWGCWGRIRSSWPSGPRAA